MNNAHHAEFDQAFYCTTLCTDLMHMVEILNSAHGRSWTWRRMSWMRKGEEVGINVLKTGVQICMRLIAGKIRWNVIG